MSIATLWGILQSKGAFQFNISYFAFKIVIHVNLSFLPCAYSHECSSNFEGFDIAAEADEVAEILANFGLEPTEYWPVVEALRKRPDAWIDFMMRYVPPTQRMNIGRDFETCRFVLAMDALFTLAFSKFSSVHQFWITNSDMMGNKFNNDVIVLQI